MAARIIPDPTVSDTAAPGQSSTENRGMSKCVDW